jgi:3-hydroxyisobutyrate dehydrogenase-like beta-hydroxyacid dehydrogenase
MITGFLHPGSMGASLAASCAGERLWVGRGRSDATRLRASEAGLREVSSLDALAAQAEVIVSVCPPAAAVDQAEAVAATEFDGLYVDLNAVSPKTARSIAGLFDRFVDGGIIGPPVHTPGSTRMYLAGTEARSVAARWKRSPLEVRILHGELGAASAVKTCFAAWTKGTAALLLAVQALAKAEGIDDALIAEWATSIPDLPQQAELRAFQNGPKAWRFAGEMDQIAEAFAAQGLPDGFASASAEVYRRLTPLKDSPGPPIEIVLAHLLTTDASARRA